MIQKAKHERPPLASTRWILNEGSVIQLFIIAREERELNGNFQKKKEKFPLSALNPALFLKIRMVA